jgi:hypothetical protein
LIEFQEPDLLVRVNAGQKYIPDKARILCGRLPSLIAVNQFVPGLVAKVVDADLKPRAGAVNLLVDFFLKTSRLISQVCLHSLALGDTDLPQPAILQNRQERQQPYQRSDQEQGERLPVCLESHAESNLPQLNCGEARLPQILQTLQTVYLD